MQEFNDFLKQYKVIGLAVAFVMGLAATTLVQSLVNNVIMPIITPFIPGGAWQTATFTMGPIVIGLAVAFVMGLAATTLVQSLVNNVIIPIITPFIPGGAWQTATFNIGPILIGWGAFLAALINFIIIAIAIFLIVKMVVREDKKK